MTSAGPRFHFISGLPRSGSSLLSAILRQNPAFHADVTSPVAMLVGRLVQAMSDGGEFASFFSEEKRQAVLHSMIQGYYADHLRKSVVFDTNRGWTGRLPLILRLFPDAHIVCCVRKVSWVLDSIERFTRRNALQPSRLFDFKTGGTVYSRVETLMNQETGLVGLAWSSLREAWFGEHSHRLLIVNYDRLVEEPAECLRRLYRYLGEEPFTHDLQNVAFDSPQYDADLGAPGLHRVRKMISLDVRDTCLPPDIFGKYDGADFWSNPTTSRGAKIVC